MACGDILRWVNAKIKLLVKKKKRKNKLMEKKNLNIEKKPLRRKLA